MRQIYEEACKEGTGKVYRTRIMLVGHFAAGKTSVKRSLLSEPFVQDHLSTEGVETEETVNVISTHVEEDKKGTSTWEKVWSELSHRFSLAMYGKLHSQVEWMYENII